MSIAVGDIIRWEHQSDPAQEWLVVGIFQGGSLDVRPHGTGSHGIYKDMEDVTWDPVPAEPKGEGLHGFCAASNAILVARTGFDLSPVDTWVNYVRRR